MSFLAVLLGDQPVLKPTVTYYQRLLARDQDEAIDLVEDYLRSHPVRDVYEKILLPALVMTKENKSRDDFTADDVRYILLAVREMVDDLAGIRKKEKLEDGAAPAPAEADSKKVLVLGCPANDEADELALLVFGQYLDPPRCDLEVIPANTLAGEIVERVHQEGPGVVCVGTLPAAGHAAARYLCKQLRAEAPGLKIVVGCWGLEENIELTRERLLSAGADQVGVSYEETRGQILALIQVVSQAQAPWPATVATR
jgi:hypothetical protein